MCVGHQSVATVAQDPRSNDSTTQFTRAFAAIHDTQAAAVRQTEGEAIQRFRTRSKNLVPPINADCELAITLVKVDTKPIRTPRRYLNRPRRFHVRYLWITLELCPDSSDCVQHAVQ